VENLAAITNNGQPVIVMIRVFDWQGRLGGFHAVVVDGVTKRFGVDVVAIRDPIGRPHGGRYFQRVEDFAKIVEKPAGLGGLHKSPVASAVIIKGVK